MVSPNDKFPKLFEEGAVYPLTNRNIVVPNYPNGAFINAGLYDELKEPARPRRRCNTIAK